MIAKISTKLNCTDVQLWSEIIKPQTLQYIAAPLLYFIPINNDEPFNEWIVGKTYKFKIFLLKYIPLGRHDITITVIDKKTNRIETKESGFLSPTWNHSIWFNNTGNGLEYTDQIEIKAGLITFLIWIFAQIFYRNRHRKLKILLRKKYVL